MRLERNLGRLQIISILVLTREAGNIVLLDYKKKRAKRTPSSIVDLFFLGTAKLRQGAVGSQDVVSQRCSFPLPLFFC